MIQERTTYNNYYNFGGLGLVEWKFKHSVICFKFCLQLLLEIPFQKSKTGSIIYWTKLFSQSCKPLSIVVCLWGVIRKWRRSFACPQPPYGAPGCYAGVPTVLLKERQGYHPLHAGVEAVTVYASVAVQGSSCIWPWLEPATPWRPLRRWHCLWQTLRRTRSPNPQSQLTPSSPLTPK